MAYTATTWRWPDSTFGPQRNTPFNNDQFYPDCGTQRIYSLEDILYGLENVITPLLETIAGEVPATGNETSGSYVMDATPTDIGTGACKEVTIWLLSTAANADIVINSGDSVILEPGYSMTINVDDLSRIQASQAGDTDTLYFKYR